MKLLSRGYQLIGDAIPMVLDIHGSAIPRHYVVRQDESAAQRQHRLEVKIVKMTADQLNDSFLKQYDRNLSTEARKR